MKLKFNSDAVYNGVVLYKAGEIAEVTEELGFAQRWIKRGAEEVSEEGYDPGHQDDSVVDTNAGEVQPTPEVSNEEALAALGQDEEVANDGVKKETKKAKKSSK